MIEPIKENSLGTILSFAHPSSMGTRAQEVVADLYEFAKGHGGIEYIDQANYTGSLIYFLEWLKTNKGESGLRKFREDYCEVAGKRQDNGSYVSFNDDLRNGTTYNGKHFLRLLTDLDSSLSSKLNSPSIKDAFVAANIPEEVIEASSSLTDLIDKIEKNEVVSYRDTAFVEIEGKQYMLKASNNRLRSRVEAAANYHLSSHFEFIVPGFSPKPIKAGSWYFTLQEDRREEKRIERGLDYWLASFANFHRDAKNILEEELDQEGDNSEPLIIPAHSFKEVEELEEMYGQGRHNNILKFKKREVASAIEYFENSEYSSLLHSDAKEDNFVGPYLVDLENCAQGHPALDLAMLLIKYEVPLENWEHRAKQYLELRDGRIDQETYLDLQEGLKHARIYMAHKEVIGSSLRQINRDTEKSNEKLVHYALAS